MNKQIIILVIILLGLVFYKFGRSLYAPLILKIKGKETVDSRMVKLESKVLNRIKSNLESAGFIDFPKEIKIVAFKEERILQVYGSDTGVFKFIKEYPFTAFSGKLGPKLKEGDKQIPEGIYAVEYLNPNSAYYLSIKIDYPNDLDIKKSTLEDLSLIGSNIFIHGKSATVGCIPIGDKAIEEIFVIAQKAIDSKTEVIISPRDFRTTPSYPVITAIDWSAELYDSISEKLKGLTFYKSE